ncbi:hypothetical protein ACFL31_01050 [Candidatus Margulisiibacteriota bacterium]
MAEEFNPTEEGRRIAANYLSKRGWTRQRRQGLNRQLNAGFQREEFEAKEQQCDLVEGEAEEIFSREVERWRQDGSAQAKEVLNKLVEMLGNRTDLGFFAKRIVERLKREMEPF